MSHSHTNTLVNKRQSLHTNIRRMTKGLQQKRLTFINRANARSTENWLKIYKETSNRIIHLFHKGSHQNLNQLSNSLAQMVFVLEDEKVIEVSNLELVSCLVDIINNCENNPQILRLVYTNLSLLTSLMKTQSLKASHINLEHLLIGDQRINLSLISLVNNLIADDDITGDVTNIKQFIRQNLSELFLQILPSNIEIMNKYRGDIITIFVRYMEQIVALFPVESQNYKNKQFVNYIHSLIEEDLYITNNMKLRILALMAYYELPFNFQSYQFLSNTQVNQQLIKVYYFLSFGSEFKLSDLMIQKLISYSLDYQYVIGQVIDILSNNLLNDKQSMEIISINLVKSTNGFSISQVIESEVVPFSLYMEQPKKLALLFSRLILYGGLVYLQDQYSKFAENQQFNEQLLQIGVEMNQKISS